MPVPSRITDLSATAGDNSPAGTDTVGPNLDDYLRGIQAVIRGDLATKGADIASATTTDLGAVQGFAHDITGTTTITGFGTVAAGVWKVLKFEGALTLTHNATSLILPGGENITTADGDTAIFISEGSGNWRCLNYSPAAINPAKTVSTDETQALTNKTVNLSSNTLTGTTAQFNAALSDGDFATLAGTETLTNKTISGATITGGTFITNDADFTLRDNVDNTKLLRFDISNITSGNTRTFSVPDVSDALVTQVATQTMTNKTLTAPTIQGTVAAGTGLTLPAFTLGGAVTGGSQNVTGLGALGASSATINGTTPSAGKMQVVADAAGVSLALSDNTNNSLYVKHSSGNVVIGTDSGGGLTLGTNGFTSAISIDSAQAVSMASSLTISSFIGGTEQTAPSAPAANGYRIFAQDNGAGKTQLMVIFASGAAQQIAIEP